MDIHFVSSFSSLETMLPEIASYQCLSHGYLYSCKNQLLGEELLGLQVYVFLILIGVAELLSRTLLLCQLHTKSIALEVFLLTKYKILKVYLTKLQMLNISKDELLPTILLFHYTWFSINFMNPSTIVSLNFPTLSALAI